MSTRLQFFHTCGTQLLCMAYALHVSREHKDQSLESRVATQSSKASAVFTVQVWSDLHVCLCWSSPGSSVQRSTADFTRRAPSNRHLNLYTCFIVTARVGHIPPSLHTPHLPSFLPGQPPPLLFPCDDWLWKYLECTQFTLTGSSRGRLPLCLPPSLIYRRMQRVVERGHTLTGPRLCLYTQAFT